MARVNVDARLKAFLDLIAWSEGTSTSPITQDDGYDVIVTGVDGPHRMVDYDDHPFASGLRSPVLVRKPGLYSTAAGRYQLLVRYWRSYKEKLKLDDFSPGSQDLVALQQMREERAYSDPQPLDPQAAIEACKNIWASFPGNSYGQGGRTMEELLAKYADLLVGDAG